MLEQIINKINNGYNLFITGGAGSGKSYLLKELKKYFLKELTITASTGIAALNIGGTTIHSFAKLGIGNESLEVILKKIKSEKKAHNRILNCKILAIDEISMLSAKFLNLLNAIFQNIKQNSLPFGGTCVIFFGDFLQLPPVIKNYAEDGLCLNCQSWKEAEIETILLKHNHRQKQDEAFFTTLQNIRIGKNLEEAFALLQARVNKEAPKNTILLLSHKEQAKIINLQKLQSLNFTSKTFKAKIEGNEEYVKNILVYFEDSITLELKKGARVMLNCNLKIEDGLCNGTLGNVVEFESKSGFPIVLFEGVKFPVTIMPYAFVIQEEETAKPLVSFIQLPLQLAYALTIHKSQGLTFANVETDISKCFAQGQAYVSLSRAQSLEGIFLKPFTKSVFKVNQEVVRYYEAL